MQELYWIVSAQSHRQAWRENRPKEGSMIETPIGEMRVILSADPGDEWVCDFCNGTIVIRPIPAIGSYAMCGDCWKSHYGKAKPGAVCSCSGCILFLEASASMADIGWDAFARSLIVWYMTTGEPHVISTES